MEYNKEALFKRDCLEGWRKGWSQKHSRSKGKGNTKDIDILPSWKRNVQTFAKKKERFWAKVLDHRKQSSS